jgi:hypothetical protein
MIANTLVKSGHSIHYWLAATRDEIQDRLGR